MLESISRSSHNRILLFGPNTPTQECKKLCNYSSLATLFLSLQNTELGQEWHKLPKKHLKIKDELEAMTTSAKDFFSLRSAMNYALGPTVPYLGIYSCCCCCCCCLLSR